MNIGSLSIVIPCYNEANRINILLDELVFFLQDWPAACQVILVNDGSTDNTADVILSSPLYTSLSAKGLIEFIDNKTNQGKGHALKTGVLRARFDRVLTMDADMATHPSELKRWATVLNGHFDDKTVYIGCRIHQDSHITDRSIRKFVGAVFNMFVQMISPLRLKDTQCGFKLYPSPIAHIAFAQLQTLGWAHDVELLCRCQMNGYKIVEMPVEWTAVEGSKISVIKDSVKMFLQLVRIKSIIKKKV